MLFESWPDWLAEWALFMLLAGGGYLAARRVWWLAPPLMAVVAFVWLAAGAEAADAIAEGRMSPSTQWHVNIAAACATLAIIMGMTLRWKERRHRAA